VLRLLLDKKATLYRNNGNRTSDGVDETITLDVEMDVLAKNEGEIDNIRFYLTPSESNISILIDKIGEISILRNNIDVNKVDMLISLLTAKYMGTIDASFIKFYKSLYAIRGNGRQFYSNGVNSNNFKNIFKNILDSVLTTTGGDIVTNTLLDMNHSYYYRRRSGIWQIINECPEAQNLKPDINYTLMPDRHLIIFKECIEWLIQRHANYISVDEKENEAVILYLGTSLLQGKKHTKSVLESHFNLMNMYTEIERRGL
jgi:predicted small secreted protein